MANSRLKFLRAVIALPAAGLTWTQAGRVDNARNCIKDNRRLEGENERLREKLDIAVYLLHQCDPCLTDEGRARLRKAMKEAELG